MVWNSMVHTLVNGISLFFTSPNARIQKTNYRTYVVLNVGTAVGIALHVTMMSVFAALGAVGLVRFNVVSIAAFVLAMCFNRRGWHLASVLTSVLELTVHHGSLCDVPGLGDRISILSGDSEHHQLFARRTKRHQGTSWCCSRGWLTSLLLTRASRCLLPFPCLSRPASGFTT